MAVVAFEPIGFEGELVSVEVDIRRGIPSVDIVGLPDGAVKEARDRVRAAIRNSGFEFPSDRLLISLAPAGLKKGGASFDLAIAMAILLASGQLPYVASTIMSLGELELSGKVRAINAVLPAVAEGIKAGIRHFIMPRANLEEARVLAGPDVSPIDSLQGLSGIMSSFLLEPDRASRPSVTDFAGSLNSGFFINSSIDAADEPDMEDIRGQPELRRAMELSAAGGHHMLLFGPPGSGKTMAARRMKSLLPNLNFDESLTATKLHSLAGLLPEMSGLMIRPPFRMPHHGASAEGMVGGGKHRKPGEISLAHSGILFLDEAAEFRTDVLQALREPLEEGRITIARADRIVSYPSSFTLILSCNPCPCGNLGRSTAVCLCSQEEIRRYWKRLGGPLLDRIDIRMPVKAVNPSLITEGKGEGSGLIKKRVSKARTIQAARYAGKTYKLNGHLPAADIDVFCGLDAESKGFLIKRAEEEGFSSRAVHSVLRLARTVADLAGNAYIKPEQLEEACNLRRYGDSDIFWIIP